MKEQRQNPYLKKLWKLINNSFCGKQWKILEVEQVLNF